MAKILIFINHSLALYKFRKELPLALLSKGHNVVVCYPNNDKDEYFESIGCEVIHFSLKRKSKNPFIEIKNVFAFKNLCKKIKPDVVLTYTIKCCLYGSFLPKNIKKIATITGESSFFNKRSALKNMIHRAVVKRIGKYDSIFFQNEKNFSDYSKIIKKKTKNFTIVPGSGVNLIEHPYQGRIIEKTKVFTFVGRLIKEKGIYEFLHSSLNFCNDDCLFYIAGPCEDDSILNYIKSLNASRIIYLGDVDDVNSLYKKSSCIVLPSYSEGMSNALLEAQASGRPTIASNIPGCRETMVPNKSGLLCEPRDSESLGKAMNVIMSKSNDQLTNMGILGRKHVEERFSREKVIESYLDKISILLASDKQNN